MKRVAANCADSDIMVGTFADESIGSFSIVFINNATTAKSVTLSTAGDTLPGQLEMRRTTASEGFVDGGMVASTVSISLPAQSIVSLGHKVRVGSGTHVKRPRAVARVPLSQRRPGGSTAFDLRGRRVTRTESCRRRGAAVMSSGAYPRAASVLVVAGQGASAGLDLSVVRAP
jgi:hypothetical protein